MHKIDFLEVCFSKAFGGLELYPITLSENLIKSKKTVHFFCQRNSKIETVLLTKKIPFTSFNFRKYNIFLSLKIRKFIKKNNVKTIHTHASKDIFVINLAIFGLKNIKHFYFQHMLINYSKRDIFHRIIFSRINGVIVANEIIKEKVKKYLPFKENKYIIIPYGMDLKKFNPAKYKKGTYRKELKIKKNQPLIGLLSRLDPQKGQKEFILSIPKILKFYPNSIFLIVGDPTRGLKIDYKQELFDLVARLKIQNRVIFKRFVENTAPILNDLDIYVSAAYSDTFPLGIIEAMLMETPIVATNSGGVPAMLEYGDCGLLVKPKSVDSLKDGIIKLLKNKKLRDKLRKKARQVALSKYNFKNVISAIVLYSRNYQS